MVSNQAQNRPSIGFLDDGKKKKNQTKKPDFIRNSGFLCSPSRQRASCVLGGMRELIGVTQT